MNNDELKMPDDFFKQGLEGYEAPYSEGAWEDMRNLLDKSERKSPFLFWFRRNKKTTFTLITTIMITTTIISLWSIWSTMKTPAIKNISKADEKNLSQTEVMAKGKTKKSEETMQVLTPTKNAKTAVGEKINVQQKNEKSVWFKNTQAIRPLAKASVDIDGKEHITTADVARENNNALVATEEAIAAENTVETGEEKTAKATEVSENKTAENNATAANGASTKTPGTGGPYTTFRGPFLGIHYTMQFPENPLHMDSGRQQAGFNIQLMSRNRISSSDFGVYLGADFGMQFYGRGKNYGVVLNNSSLDSGFTRLSMHSLDFFARSHFEYARFPLKPYVNLFAGPRIYVTRQYTEAYHHKADYENSSGTSANVAASFMYGGALGMRLAVSRHVSLDARVEYMQGTQTRVADLDASNFDGGLAAFKMNKVTLDPAYFQFKFGVLFDLYDDEVDERKDYDPLEKDEVTQTTEYYYYDSTSKTYIKVNCSCKETPVDSSGNTKSSPKVYSNKYPYNNFDTVEERNQKGSSGRRSGSGNLPSGGSGGRGGFPGIKPGGGGGVIRN